MNILNYCNLLVTLQDLLNSWVQIYIIVNILYRNFQNCNISHKFLWDKDFAIWWINANFAMMALKNVLMPMIEKHFSWKTVIRYFLDQSPSVVVITFIKNLNFTANTYHELQHIELLYSPEYVTKSKNKRSGMAL